MHLDPLETWEKDSIFGEIEVTRDIDVRQTRFECPWCEKKHLVVMDKTRTGSGHMLCGNCGEFFKWLVRDERGNTRRVRGKPKRSFNHGQTGRISATSV